MRRIIQLDDAQRGHTALASLWRDAKAWLMAGHQLEIEARPKRRTTEQNARMWAMLSDVARQVEWYGRKLAPEDWKCIFTAALKKQDVVPGLNGGFVVVGGYTSKMTRHELADLMQLIEAFGAEKGVKFKTTRQEDENL